MKEGVNRGAARGKKATRGCGSVEASSMNDRADRGLGFRRQCWSVDERPSESLVTAPSCASGLCRHFGCTLRWSLVIGQLAAAVPPFLSRIVTDTVSLRGCLYTVVAPVELWTVWLIRLARCLRPS